jgi:hypothetical protein
LNNALTEECADQAFSAIQAQQHDVSLPVVQVFFTAAPLLLPHCCFQAFTCTPYSSTAGSKSGGRSNKDNSRESKSNIHAAASAAVMGSPDPGFKGTKVILEEDEIPTKW